MKTFILTLVGMLAIAGGAARMQEPPKTHEHGEATMPAAPTTRTMAQMPMMNMEARDKKLDTLVTELSAAKGNDRIDQLVAVVNELVAERKDMRGMMSMHGGMMNMMNGMMTEKTKK